MSRVRELKWMSVKSIENNKPLEDSEERSPFLKGYGSVIHRPPFRRLSDKTQVYIHPQNDHVRTRLTHSIEAQQIGKQLARIFCKELGIKEYKVDGQRRDNFYQDFEDLTASACLAHDMGHPPFGHTGEEALQESMDNLKITLDKLNVTFESNKQNIRLLLGLGFKKPYNIPYALLDAIMKYKDSSFSNSGKKYPGYYEEEKDKAEKIIEATGLKDIRHPACYLMEAADDIAYICGDIEDSIRLEDSDQINKEDLIKINKQQLIDKLEGIPTGQDNKGQDNKGQDNKNWQSLIENKKSHPHEITAYVMRALMRQCYNVIKSLKLEDIFEKANDQFPSKLKDKILHIQHNEEKFNLLYCNSKPNDGTGSKIHGLKEWLYKDNILRSSLVAKERLSAKKTIKDLFEILFEGLKNLESSATDKDFNKSLIFLMFASQNKERIKSLVKKAKSTQEREANIARFVCDYISGMTDSFAISLWKKLKTPLTLKKDF